MLTEQQVEAALAELRDDLKKQGITDEATLLDHLVGEEDYRRLIGCPQDRLPAFIDGNVPQDEREKIEAHLLDCPFCREEVEGTRLMCAEWDRMQSEGRN